jgi:hypothetical protein
LNREKYTLRTLLFLLKISLAYLELGCREKKKRKF